MQASYVLPDFARAFAQLLEKKRTNVLSSRKVLIFFSIGKMYTLSYDFIVVANNMKQRTSDKVSCFRLENI